MIAPHQEQRAHHGWRDFDRATSPMGHCCNCASVIGICGQCKYHGAAAWLEVECPRCLGRPGQAIGGYCGSAGTVDPGEQGRLCGAGHASGRTVPGFNRRTPPSPAEHCRRQQSGCGCGVHGRPARARWHCANTQRDRARQHCANTRRDCTWRHCANTRRTGAWRNRTNVQRARAH